MNFPGQVFQSSAGLGAILLSLASMALMVFWIVVAWRAMRAHERLAEQHRELAAAMRELSRGD